MELKFWAATDFGKHRDHNEDNYLIDKNLQLFMVCDGMGGHAAGEVASAITAQTVRDHISENPHALGAFQQRQGSRRDQDRDKILNLMEQAIRQASARVFDSAKENSGRQGMGTTCDALLICDDFGFVGHVGDSRIYRIRDDNVEQLTEDHSLHNELLQQGKIEEGEDFPDKNAITRAVGVNRDVEVDTFAFPIEPDDRFLLCSDGLSNYIDESNEVFELMKGKEMKSVVDNCIDYANDSGGEDNITVVVVGAFDGAEDVDDDEGVEVLNYLEKLPYFQHLTEYELIQVGQRAEVREFDEGEYIGTTGEAFDDLAIVLEGELRVERDGATVAELLAGDYYGELGFLDQKPEPVSLKANSRIRVALLKRHPLLELLRRESNLAVKIFWNISQVFCSKFRELPVELYLDTADVDASQIDLDKETPSTGRISGEDSQVRAFKEEELEKLEKKANTSFDSKDKRSTDTNETGADNIEVRPENESQEEPTGREDADVASDDVEGNTSVVDPSDLDTTPSKEPEKHTGLDSSDSDGPGLQLGDTDEVDQEDDTADRRLDTGKIEGESIPAYDGDSDEGAVSDSFDEGTSEEENIEEVFELGADNADDPFDDLTEDEQQQADEAPDEPQGDSDSKVSLDPEDETIDLSDDSYTAKVQEIERRLGDDAVESPDSAQVEDGSDGTGETEVNEEEFTDEPNVQPDTGGSDGEEREEFEPEASIEESEGAIQLGDGADEPAETHDDLESLDVDEGDTDPEMDSDEFSNKSTDEDDETSPAGSSDGTDNEGKREEFRIDMPDIAPNVEVESLESDDSSEQNGETEDVTVGDEQLEEDKK